MKREGERNEALISPLTTLVSRHFMFRFTVPLVAHERSANKQLTNFVRPFSLLLRRFRGREFLKAGLIAQRIEHRIEREQCGNELWPRARAWNGSVLKQSSKFI